MEIRRFTEAKSYPAPNHRDYISYRLFGAEAGGPSKFMVMVSHYLPGGGAGPDATPTEKVYFCLDGEVTIIAGGKEATLKPNDSVYLAPNEEREIVNRGHTVATIVAILNAIPK